MFRFPNGQHQSPRAAYLFNRLERRPWPALQSRRLQNHKFRRQHIGRPEARSGIVNASRPLPKQTRAALSAWITAGRRILSPKLEIGR
jgi:hypothetical protein